MTDTPSAEPGVIRPYDGDDAKVRPFQGRDPQVHPFDTEPQEEEEHD